MSKIIKISDSTTLKLKELMNALQDVGCNSEEKLKARKIFPLISDYHYPFCVQQSMSQYYLLKTVFVR